MSLASEAYTCEEPAPGVCVWQPRKGHRFGQEVYLLAHFALEGGVARTAVDLGAGSGILAMLLASQGVDVMAVEREPRWWPLLEEAIRVSEVSGRVRLHRGDVRDVDLAEVVGEADLVVTNPPYFPPAGTVSPDSWRASARSMLHGDTRSFVEAGLRLAPRVCMVTRPERVDDVATLPVRRRAACGDRLALVEVVRGAAATARVEVDLAAAYARFRRAVPVPGGLA